MQKKTIVPPVLMLVAALAAGFLFGWRCGLALLGTILGVCIAVGRGYRNESFRIHFLDGSGQRKELLLVKHDKKYVPVFLCIPSHPLDDGHSPVEFLADIIRYLAVLLGEDHKLIGLLSSDHHVYHQDEGGNLHETWLRP